MPNYLPVPPELEHLIEKRETEDCREKERRSGQDRRIADLGPSEPLGLSQDLDDSPPADRRSGDERRQDGDRRKAARRQTDVDPPLPEPTP